MFKKMSFSEKIFNIVVLTFLTILMFVTLYPIVLVFSMSVSDPINVINGEVLLLPKGLSVESYAYVMKDQEMWTAYGNTIFYTVFGTMINLGLTILGAYTLSRKTFDYRNVIMVGITLTMFFSGGLIPLFITVSKLGLYNTRWSVILPTAVSVYNLIVARTFFQNVPESLHESAFIDGANEFRIFYKIYIPLCKPIIAVLVLFYAVRHWNSYFHAMLFLSDKAKQPIQLYLIRVVMDNIMSSLDLESAEDVRRQLIAVQLKYTVIVIVMLPIITLYPFVQKYFVKGIMIGAIKG